MDNVKLYINKKPASNVDREKDRNKTCTVEDILVNEASFLPSRLAATDSHSFSAISSAYK